MLERQFVFFQPQIWKSKSQIIQETFSELDSMVKWRKQIRLKPELNDLSPRNDLFPAILSKIHLSNQFFFLNYPTGLLLAATSMMCPMSSHTCSFISLEDLVKTQILVQSLRVGPWDSAFMINKLPDDPELLALLDSGWENLQILEWLHVGLTRKILDR